MSEQAEGNSSFDVFMEKIMACVRKVNNASRAIGSTNVLDDASELWKAYKSSLDGLYDTIKNGQRSGNGVEAVKNCTAELLYDEKTGGGDKSPLTIVGVWLRGWVKTTQLAGDNQSSVSSSSSSSSSGGGG